MANPNPVRRGTKADINNPNPKLRTREVLVWLEGQKYDEFTSGDVANHFGLETSEGSSRLGLLKKWGCVRIRKRQQGREPFIYELTKWGCKMALKWKE